MIIADRKIQVFWRPIELFRLRRHFWEGAMAEILDWSWICGPLEIRVWRRGARP